MMKDLFKRFLSDDRGATATEYIILLILIACFVIAIVAVFGGTVSGKFESANTAVEQKVVF